MKVEEDLKRLYLEFMFRSILKHHVNIGVNVEVTEVLYLVSIWVV